MGSPKQTGKFAELLRFSCSKMARKAEMLAPQRLRLCVGESLKTLGKREVQMKNQ